MEYLQCTNYIHEPRVCVSNLLPIYDRKEATSVPEGMVPTKSEAPN